MTISRSCLLSLVAPARSYSRVIIAGLALALCGRPTPAGAQVLYGSLVGNVTDDSFDDILDRDQSRRSAEFIDDDGHLYVLALKLAEQVRHFLRLRNSR